MSRRANWTRRCGARRSWRIRRPTLKQLGFEPDIIIGHHGWGELLNIRDVWPDTPLLGYLEFYYCIDGIDVGFDPEFPTQTADHPRIRAKNAVNLLALNLERACADADQMAALDLSGVGAEIHHAAAGRRQSRCMQAESAGAAAQSEDRRYRHQAEREAGHLCGARPGAVSRLPCDDAGGAAPAACTQGHPRGDGRWRRHQLRHAAGGRHLAAEDAGGARQQHRPTAGGVSRSRRLPDLCRDAAALGRARVSDLSVRCVMVAARGAGRGLRRDRQRHADGERVRDARAERAAGAVLRSEGTGADGAAGRWRMRRSHVGCGRTRGVMPRSTWR